MGRPFFEYRTDEADAIHAALQATGLQNEEHWPGYRKAIEATHAGGHRRKASNRAACLMLRKLRSSSRNSSRPSRSRSDGMKHYRLNCSSLSTLRWKRFSYKTRCSPPLSLHLRDRWLSCSCPPADFHSSSMP